MNNQGKKQKKKDKKLEVPKYSHISKKDIRSYLYMHIFWKYKENDVKLPRKQLNHIASFIAGSTDLTYYESWVYLRTMTKDVVLLMNVDDFSELIRAMKEQSRMYQSKYLIKREYEASRWHPYNKNPIPVYEFINGKYTLVSGVETFREEIIVTIGSEYSGELKTSEYQMNKNIKLDLENIKFMKEKFVEDHNSGRNYKAFEYQYLANLEQPKNVSLSMYMLDSDQFTINESAKDPRFNRRGNETDFGWNKKAYAKDLRVFRRERVTNFSWNSNVSINTDVGTNISDKEIPELYSDNKSEKKHEEKNDTEKAVFGLSTSKQKRTM